MLLGQAVLENTSKQVVWHNVVGTSSVVGATPVNQVVEHCVFGTNGVQATPLTLV